MEQKNFESQETPVSASAAEAKAELTFGMKAVGLTFNPSGKQEVIDIKTEAAKYIDLLNDLRIKAGQGEVGRQLSVAITEAQTSQMWAVKAVTWQY